MFESDSEIYQHIGSRIQQTLPEEGWSVAWIDVLMQRLDVRLTHMDSYKVRGEDEEKDFDVEEGGNAKIAEAFFALYKVMRKDEDDVPWNKARYTLYPDGEFDIEFKYDADFAWLKSLDPDSDRRPKSSVRRQIQSWEGLPEDVERPWQQ